MALHKSLPTPFGGEITASYHRIARLDVDFSEKRVRGVLQSYANEAAYQANKNPLMQSPFEWGEKEWLFSAAEPTRQATYERLKETPALFGAEDV
jgi:hypothetical protein